MISHIGPTLCKWVKTSEFSSLNPGMALDEGMPSSTNEFRLSYSELIRTSTIFAILGQSGHGSQFLDNTAGEKLMRLLNIIYKHRDSEFAKKLAGNPKFCVANITMLRGGFQDNVVRIFQKILKNSNYKLAVLVLSKIFISFEW